MIFVLGLDAATWKVIKPNLEVLPNLKRLMEAGEHSTITLDEKPHSASVWCSVFSGKTREEHGHVDFVIDGELQTRGDIKVKFIWDILEGIFDIKALNIPFVYPPYNYNCDYKAVEYGLSSDLQELEQDMEQLTDVAKKILNERPDVFLVAYTMLDKLSHFHWGEPMLLEWYKKVDGKVGELLGLVKEGDKIIVLSDHGFADWNEVKEHTLPKKTPEGEIKGDHHKDAILITKNISYRIEKPEDVFFAIKDELKLGLEEKAEKSMVVIRDAFERFDKIGVAWTGGKDSTVVLALIREIFGNVPALVLFGDTTAKFNETYEFVERVTEDWDLNLVVVKPEIPDGFKIAGDKEKCCHLLKTVSAQKKIEELGLDAVIVGIRWDEQRARDSEEYFSERKDHWRVHPLLHWSEEDVWKYIKDRRIPHNPLYDKGYRSIGCKPCTKPAPSKGKERSGRTQDKEEIMERLRNLGYW